MVKKVKRKYVRRVVLEAPQSTPVPIKEEINSRPSGVTQADIDMLPPSLVYQLQAMTLSRKMFNLPDNLKERTEAMVRRFRGY